MKRLYQKIYLTIIASLLLVVLVAGAVWRFRGDRMPVAQAFEMAGEPAAAAPPRAPAPPPASPPVDDTPGPTPRGAAAPCAFAPAPDPAGRLEGGVGARGLSAARRSPGGRPPLSRIRLGIGLSENNKAPKLKGELARDAAELARLIDEILLASRLDAAPALQVEPIDLLG